MEASVSNALFLLAVGMITVFAILSLVVVTGHVLVSIVNKWTPEKPAVSQNPDDTTISIISKIVDKVSKGKAQIEKIEAL